MRSLGPVPSGEVSTGGSNFYVLRAADAGDAAHIVLHGLGHGGGKPEWDADLIFYSEGEVPVTSKVYPHGDHLLP